MWLNNNYLHNTVTITKETDFQRKFLKSYLNTTNIVTFIYG